jgi:hypothetical protein
VEETGIPGVNWKMSSHTVASSTHCHEPAHGNVYSMQLYANLMVIGIDWNTFDNVNL